MKERHFAYKITEESSGLICTHLEFEKDRMVDLLKKVKNSNFTGIYWIFKQLDDHPKEQLCIIDPSHGRIYYHHSGEVEDISDLIKKLTK
jgi:hypothetical protein